MTYIDKVYESKRIIYKEMDIKTTSSIRSLFRRNDKNRVILEVKVNQLLNIVSPDYKQCGCIWDHSGGKKIIFVIQSDSIIPILESHSTYIIKNAMCIKSKHFSNLYPKYKTNLYVVLDNETTIRKLPYDIIRFCDELNENRLSQNKSDSSLNKKISKKQEPSIRPQIDIELMRSLGGAGG